MSVHVQPPVTVMPSEWLDSTAILRPSNRGDRFGTIPAESAEDDLSLDPMLRNAAIKPGLKEKTMEPFKPGDVVRLKSGGPKMTVRNFVPIVKPLFATAAVDSQAVVTTVVEHPVTCDWFYGYDPKEGTFAAETLAIVPDPDHAVTE